MNKEEIKQELVEFVNCELKECEKYAKTAEDVLRRRDVAFGAVMFAFCLDSSLYGEMHKWWNEDILPWFNDIMNSKK